MFLTLINARRKKNVATLTKKMKSTLALSGASSCSWILFIAISNGNTKNNKTKNSPPPAARARRRRLHPARRRARDFSFSFFSFSLLRRRPIPSSLRPRHHGRRGIGKISHGTSRCAGRPAGPRGELRSRTLCRRRRRGPPLRRRLGLLLFKVFFFELFLFFFSGTGQGRIPGALPVLRGLCPAPFL